MGREPGKGVGKEAWKGTWKKGIWKGNLERNPGKESWKGNLEREPGKGARKRNLKKRIFKLSLESNPVQLGNQESWIVNGNQK